LCWRFTAAFVDINQPIPAVARSIANAHTIFNVLNSLVLLPFTAGFARFINRLLPAAQPTLLSRSLAPRLLAMPALALDAVAAEVRNTSVQVRDMHALASRAVLEPDRAAVDELRRADESIDDVLQEVTQYSLRLSQQDIGPGAARRREALLITLRNMEQIGDLYSTDLARLALKRMEQGLDFSAEGFEELKRVFDEVAKSFDNTLLVLAGKHDGAIREVIEKEDRMDGERRALFERHLSCLIRRDPQTARTLAIHMDVLTALRQVHSLLADTVRALAEKPHAQAPADDARQAPPSDVPG
ncbi:MAG TPA: PhoU domain-containing protein, partial [Candidatus Brocadiia bacterium]|nr:PhoU domain-containing protein [Candidatus Brocadiia bacterium]